MTKRKTEHKLPDRPSRWMVILILFILAISAQIGSAADQLKVYVVNYPLKYFTERIGDDHVQVEFPVPGNVDPAYWNPDVATISAFQKADLILLNGAGYAKWVRKVSLPRSKMVDTAKKYKQQYTYTKDVVTHSHGGEGKHAHEALAFTTWLNFELAAGQAEAIAAALGRRRPSLKGKFQNNLNSLVGELKALDQRIQKITSQNKSMPLIVSHPVYDYFTQRYGLNIVSVHWEPEEVPTKPQLVELQKIIDEHPAKWMIWEGEPDPRSVNILKTLGVDSLVFDPCGNKPEEGDFMTVMRRNIDNLSEAFK
jgi:zinc transport system substrate-binding protein